MIYYHMWLNIQLLYTVSIHNELVIFYLLCTYVNVVIDGIFSTVIIAFYQAVKKSFIILNIESGEVVFPAICINITIALFL